MSVPAQSALAILSQPQVALAQSDTVDVVEVIEAVRLLLRLGARPLAIGDLTGASQPLIRNQAQFEGANTEDKGGRRPRSMCAIVDNVEVHMEASIFLKAYIHQLGIYETKADWGAEAVDFTELDVQGSLVRGPFLRAVHFLHHMREGSTQLTVDQARLVAVAHSRGDAKLVHCEICPCCYLRSESALAARAMPRGECPMCRKLAAIGHARTPARITDRARARQLYARIAGHGVRLGIAEPVERQTVGA